MHRIATNDEGDEIHEASVLRRRERRKRDVSRLTVLPYWINFNARGIIEQVHRGTRADTRVRIMQSRMLLEFDRDKWCVHVIFVKWARSRLKVDDRKWNIEFGWISRHYAFTDFISRLQSHWISAPNLIIRSFCVRVPLFYRGLEYLQFPQNTRNTYDSSMIIPLYVSTSSQDPLFWPSWNCESLEIFISTGRDSQLPYYQYLKLMPDATRVTIYVGKNRR